MRWRGSKGLTLALVCRFKHFVHLLSAGTVLILEFSFDRETVILRRTCFTMFRERRLYQKGT